ncbi:MAG: 23S rRNA (adenine(2503)-C(2))-methyltransferase RlmN [Kyrpidia sp.]|nr:23S rRNA (adenine(2503)-C(2))-methyltransferase RlmN [Kyrpidia sp.]
MNRSATHSESGDRPIHLYGLRPDELRAWLEEKGEPGYRAAQLFDWMYKKRVTGVEAMTNLPKSLRALLRERTRLTTMEELTRQVSKKDGTTKFLFRLFDGSTVETVLMRHSYGNSVCVSTQVGCHMGCAFCASTLGGLVRNLTAGEMMEQVLACQRLLDAEGGRVSSVVLMGSGEPLENYEATVRFMDLVSAEEGLRIGQRHITVSTSGLVPAIRRLAKERRQITLAVSLHAPNDEVRGRLMPINRAYPIAKLLEACREYWEETGRRVTFEYALIGGVNDRLDQARELAGRLRGLPCHVNLIPVNYVPERRFERTPREQVQAFRKELERRGISCTVRREMGADIAAACGQLRAGHRMAEA